MKVLKTSKVKTFEVTEKCFFCGSKLSIGYEDCRYFAGKVYYTCPVCETEGELNLKHNYKYKIYRYRNVEKRK